MVGWLGGWTCFLATGWGGEGGGMNGNRSVTFMRGDLDGSMNGTQSFFNAPFSGLRS